MPTGARPAIVVDSSAVVAVLTDEGELGDWVQDRIRGHRLVAPTHLLVEGVNAIRRLTLSGQLTPSRAALAQRHLVRLPVHLVPYPRLAERTWELRHVLTAYDAAYVALAEGQQVPLVTLDQGIRGAPGVRCDIRTP